MKLHLGCGGTILPGWVNIDKYSIQADVSADVARLEYADSSIDKIYTSHMIEHLPILNFEKALIEWHRILKSQGILIIRCPDAQVHIERWLTATDEERIDLSSGILNCVLGIQTQGPGYYNHNLFTVGTLRCYLESAGFEVQDCYSTTDRVSVIKKLHAGNDDDGFCVPETKKVDIWCQARAIK